MVRQGSSCPPRLREPIRPLWAIEGRGNTFHRCGWGRPASRGRSNEGQSATYNMGVGLERGSSMPKTLGSGSWLVVATFCLLTAACAGPSAQPTLSASRVAASGSTQASPPADFQATAPTDPHVEGTVEFVEWLVTCAAENGEVVEPIYGDPPAIRWTGSRARTELIVDQCRETALTEGWIIPSPFDGSAEGNRLMYRLWIPVHECLREHGYPTEEPPSEEAFIDQGSEL